MSELIYDLLGLRLQALTPGEIVAITSRAIEKAEHHIIANHNLHSLYIYHHDATTRKFFDQADYIHIDGMAIVGLGQLLKIPLRREHRATYIDLLPRVFAEAEEKGWKIFYLGSKSGVLERAIAKLKKQYPALLIRGRNGHFNAEKPGRENKQVLAEINAYAPAILMVGMGMPRQENWLAENWPSLGCNAAFCCGAALDYVAGEIPTPPRWLGQLGLEWLYRLLAEPKRLWRRYLLEPWFVLVMLARHFLVGGRPDHVSR
jgi:N-acetylglucosaminyldiphosphoundecaprenol N-acetyl-beta-D-mannosaminyltransferase